MTKGYYLEDHRDISIKEKAQPIFETIIKHKQWNELWECHYHKSVANTDYQDAKIMIKDPYGNSELEVTLNDANVLFLKCSYIKRFFVGFFAGLFLLVDLGFFIYFFAFETNDLHFYTGAFIYLSMGISFFYFVFLLDNFSLYINEFVEIEILVSLLRESFKLSEIEPNWVNKINTRLLKKIAKWESPRYREFFG